MLTGRHQSVNHVFVHHEGKRTSWSHSEKTNKKKTNKKTVASCFFDCLCIPQFGFVLACVLVTSFFFPCLFVCSITFVTLLVCSFACFDICCLVFMSVLLFDCLLVCLFRLVYLCLVFHLAALLSVFACNIELFFLFLSMWFLFHSVNHVK